LRRKELGADEVVVAYYKARCFKGIQGVFPMQSFFPFSLQLWIALDTFPAIEFLREVI